MGLVSAASISDHEMQRDQHPSKADGARFFVSLKSAVVGQLDGGGEDEHTGSSPAPVWVDTMSIRFHTMAAAKGYHPSFLAIGDAFFYGRGGLPRYEHMTQSTRHCDHNISKLVL